MNFLLGALALFGAASADEDWTSFVQVFEAMFKTDATCNVITECEKCVDAACGAVYTKDIGKYVLNAPDILTAEQKTKYNDKLKSGFFCGIDVDSASAVKDIFDLAVTQQLVKIDNYQSFMINDCGAISPLIVTSLSAIVAYLAL